MKKATRHKQTRQQDNKVLMDFLGAASASGLRTSSATGRSGGASPVDRAVSGFADGLSPTKPTLNGDTRRPTQLILSPETLENGVSFYTWDLLVYLRTVFIRFRFFTNGEFCAFLISFQPMKPCNLAMIAISHNYK